VLLAPICLVWLDDRPEEAKWLTQRERDWLSGRLHQERADATTLARGSIWRALFNKRVLTLTLIWSGASTASAGLALWQPQLIRSLGASTLQTGLLNAIPFLLSGAATILWGIRSDKAAERMWHIAVPMGISAVGIIMCAFSASLSVTIILLCVGLIGTQAIRGPFWAFRHRIAG